MSKYKKEKEEPEIPVSPLLALDADGRTPLHLCCIEPAPTKILIRVMNSARDAAAVKDKNGSLPLHLAVQNRRTVSVIDKLVRGYYQGSWTGDGEDKTPLILSIEVAQKKQTEENLKPTKTYWGFPASPEDIEWQEKQQKLWEVASFFVKNRAARRKTLLTMEHTQILVALGQSAPPEVISNMFTTGKKALSSGDLAGKVLFLLINRQYPMHLFRSLLDVVSTDYTKDQQDSTGCGVVAAHFRVGCIKHKGHENERDSFVTMMKKLADTKNNLHGDFLPTPQYVR